MAKTYSGGIPFKRNLADTDKKIAFCPDRILLPLSKGAKCLVKEGDEIKKYSMIASKTPASPALFCGVGGRVEHKFRASGRTALSIVTDKDAPSEEPLPTPKKKLADMSQEELEELLKTRGIPAIKQGKREPRCLIVDCGASPHDLSRLHICQAHPDKVVAGAKIIMKLLRARSCKFALPNSNLDAARSIEKRLPSRTKMFSIVFIKDKLPAFIPHLTVAAVCNLEISRAKDVFDAGYPVISPLLCLACYNALVDGIPFCEGFLTVTDKDGSTKILSLPFGSELDKTVDIPKKYTLARAEGLYGKSAINSIMTPYTEAVRVVPDNDKVTPPSPCIECRRCIGACPARLIPIDIYRKVKTGKADQGLDYYAAGCFECRACTHVCPSHIPLAEAIIKLRRESGIITVDIPDGDPDFYTDGEPGKLPAESEVKAPHNEEEKRDDKQD